MKTPMIRRIVAGVAVSGLLIAAAPSLATTASGTTVAACDLGQTCTGALTGALGASPYEIEMPASFNGTVLIFSHGYRIGTPVPAALAVPLGLASDPISYQKTSVPAFASTFGSDVAYVGSNTPVVAPYPTVEASLLAQGYALAGAGYAKQGWAVAEGVDAGQSLIKYINAGGVKGVKKIMVWGESLGGLITATLAENNPGKVAGSLPACGVVMGPEQAFGSAMTVLYTWKTLVAPTLRVANYQSYPQALSDLATVLSLLGTASTKPIAPTGFPIAQANMLAGLMGGLPTNQNVWDGQTPNPAFAQLGTLGGLAGGYNPSSAQASSVVAMLQNVGGAAALGILGRYELEQRARAIGGIPADQSANFNDNVNVSYTNLLSEEQRGEFGDVLNGTTAVADPLNTMLGTLDASKGNAALRFPANPAAVKAVEAIPHATGKYNVPTLMITTAYDPIVPAGNTLAYTKLLMASAKKQGVAMPKISTFYTLPPADGWTQFLPGGKFPDNALSIAALNGSGVGHCNFARDGGVQLVNSVAALNRLVNAKTPAQIKAANKLMFATTGVNGDGFFEPEPLKHPELSK